MGTPWSPPRRIMGQRGIGARQQKHATVSASKQQTSSTEAKAKGSGCQRQGAHGASASDAYFAVQVSTVQSIAVGNMRGPSCSW